jgi:hypothetical protein
MGVSAWRVLGCFTVNDLQEDEKLRDLVAKHGAQNWSVIAKNLPGRNGKSCRCAQL